MSPINLYHVVTNMALQPRQTHQLSAKIVYDSVLTATDLSAHAQNYVSVCLIVYFKKLTLSVLCTAFIMWFESVYLTQNICRGVITS